MARKSRKHPPIGNHSPSKISPAWIYARISNENNHAEDSIDNQIAICREYIKSSHELTFGGVFTDLGYSGTDFKRPGYSDMMAKIFSGDVKCVVVKDLSRLGRAYIEVGELLFDTFPQHGIRFVSVNEHYDSFSDDAGRKKLLILIKNLFNHMYSLDLGKKVKSAHAVKKQRGELIGLQPYGYRIGVGSKRLEIDGEAANIIKMICDMRLQGESTDSIAKYLNQNNIPSPQNHRYQLGEMTNDKFSQRIVWSMRTVSRILQNETYTGSLIQGKYNRINKEKVLLVPKEQWAVSKNTHPAIVSKEQFEAVARLMQESAEKYSRKSQKAVPGNRYSSKIFCSRCGKKVMRFQSMRSDQITFYYYCRYCVGELKFETGLKKASNLYIDRLDNIVMDILSTHMGSLGQIEASIESMRNSNLFKQKNNCIAREIAELEKTIRDYENKLLTAYTHYLSGLLNQREYKLIQKTIEDDKLNAETQLIETKMVQAKYNNIINNQWLVNYKTFRDCSVPTKDMIQTLIKRISITPLTNEITLELNFMDSYEELRQIIQENLTDRSFSDVFSLSPIEQIQLEF